MAFGPSRKRMRTVAPKGRRRFARRVVRKVSTSVRQYVAKALSRNEETKYTSLVVGGQDIGPNGATVVQPYLFLPNPAQGVARNQRVGNVCMFTGMKLKAYFNWANAFTVAGGSFRIIIGVLKQPVAVPTTATVIEGLLFNNSTGTGDYTIAIRDKDAPVRVLADKTFRSPNEPFHWVTGGGAGVTRGRHIQISVNLKKLKMNWNDSSSTPVSNQLFMYICSNSAGTTTDLIMSANARFYYKDA